MCAVDRSGGPAFGLAPYPFLGTPQIGWGLWRPGRAQQAGFRWIGLTSWIPNATNQFPGRWRQVQHPSDLPLTPPRNAYMVRTPLGRPIAQRQLWASENRSQSIGVGVLHR